MAEFSCCLLCWRWVQGQAVTRGEQQCPPAPISPHIQAELWRLQGSITARVSQGWRGIRGEQARTGRRDIHPTGASREQKLGVCLGREVGSPRLALPA